MAAVVAVAVMVVVVLLLVVVALLLHTQTSATVPARYGRVRTWDGTERKERVRNLPGALHVIVRFRALAFRSVYGLGSSGEPWRSEFVTSSSVSEPWREPGRQCPALFFILNSCAWQTLSRTGCHLKLLCVADYVPH